MKTSHILLGAVLLNLLTSFFAAWNIPTDAENTLRVIGAVSLIIFVCWHGWQRYGWRKMLVSFGITFVISWTTESLSLATGFPFGNYVYTDILGIKLGNVPLLIMLAYFFTGYLAWTMSNLFFGNFGPGLAKKHIFLVPFVSSLIMVMWDICFDPIMSTIDHKWTWHDGGAYFGVPILNFFGWFLTTYLFFQIIALLLHQSNPGKNTQAKEACWYLFPVMYMAQGLPYFLFQFFRDDQMGIYRSMSQVTVLTMFLTAALNLVVIRHKLASKNRLPAEIMQNHFQHSNDRDLPLSM